jgi:predicted Zn-dependent peptidase
MILNLLLAVRLFAAEPVIHETLATPYQDDGMKVTIHRLGNGMTAYLSPNDLEPRVSAWIATRAGSRQDPADSTGMAHYLEHMLFKGTRKIGTLDWEKEKPHLDRISDLYEKLFDAKGAERDAIYKEIDEQNGKASAYEVPNEIARTYKALGFRGLNAFTSNEKTVYVVDFPANRAEAWAKLEAERFSNPVFRLFQTELETVYEEKNRSMDNAERIIEEAVDAKLFKDHPYGRTVLGSIEHLKNPSLAKMYEFYDRYYRPENMAVILSGQFERGEMLALLERTLGKWKLKGTTKVEPMTPAPLKGAERVEVKYESEEKVVVVWPTVAALDKDLDALIVMDMLMDNQFAGIINLTLNQAQKVKAAGSSPENLNEAGTWRMWAIPKQGQTLEQAEALLMETLARLKNGEFTDEDIKAVVTDFEVKKKEQLESNQSRVASMERAFNEFRPWRDEVDFIARLKKVTKADVLAVAKRYLGDNRVVAYRRNAKPALPSISKPKFSKIAIDASRESKFIHDLIAAPVKPLEPKFLEAGRDYRTMDLPSGRLFAAPNPVNDLFSLSFVFQRGSRHDRKLCPAFQLWSLSGAGSMSAEDLKKKLYRLGTTLTATCDEQESSVQLTGLNENLWESLELMTQRFEQPNIAPDTLSNMIQVALGTQQDNKLNPGYVHNALGEFARRGAESSVLDELTAKEWQDLKEADLRKVIGKVFDFDRRTAYVGNRPLGELSRLIDSGRRGFKAPGGHKPVRFRRPAGNEVFFTHRDMVQSHVGLFWADGVFDPSIYVDLDFYRGYVGGGMSSLIFQEVREARSLAYAAGGSYAPAGHKDDDNQVYGFAGCQADKTLDAATLLRDLMTNPPLSPQRFDVTKRTIEENYRAGRTPFRVVPEQLMTWEDQGLSQDPRPERFTRSLKYTMEDLGKFATRFKDRPTSLYILGNRERVDLEKVKGLGTFSEKKLEELFPY